MAKLKNGILGGFSGTIGNISGFQRMDTFFIRSKRTPTNRPMTPKRLAQQQKIKVCNAFTKPFSGSGFFDATFPLPSGTATGYNKATSALLKKAVTGTYPDTIIAWPMVLISEGGMPAALDAEASIEADSSITFLWVNNAGIGTAKDTDKVVMVAYCPSLQQTIFTISDSRRADAQAILNTQPFAG
ncbi:MAG: DUF6266 family protein, partial [Ginsengibacter sp.]